MKKKVLSLLLALVLCLGLFPLTAFAADSDFVIRDGILTKYNGPGGDVVIPDGVTGIGYMGDEIAGCYVFAHRTDITSITIPGSVTKIDRSTFMGCTGLTSVTIKHGATAIDEWVFSGCTSLIHVDIPDSVTSIGDHAFDRCTGLTSVTIPDGVTSIGGHAFYQCTGLKSVAISNGVTSIGKNAFEGCKSLTSVSIPSSVTSIGERAFVGCESLTSVNISNGVTKIGDYAFLRCSSLTSVTISNGVTSIGNEAFYDCAGLTSVTIPGSVTSIGNEAFSHCKGLTSVTISNGVTSIGNKAFYGCTGLTSVTIPGSVAKMGNSAFYCCTGLKNVTISNGVTSIGNEAFSGCSRLTSVTIPDSVTEIGTSAFSYCTSLTSVAIPSSVKYLGRSAFCSCTNLRSVSVSHDVTCCYDTFMACYALENIPISCFTPGDSSSSDGGAPGYFGAFQATIYPDRILLTEYEGHGGDVVIPDGVTDFGYGVFSGKASVISVTIPDSVTSIGQDAFSRCSGLKEIAIPVSVTSIDNSAFSGCSDLQVYYGGTRAQWKSAGLNYSYFGGNAAIHCSDGDIHETYTVTLDARGGAVSPASISVANGVTYGDLPVPTRTGYTFNGWYTFASGGSKITANTKVDLASSQTLYARWTPDMVGNLSYSFKNSGSAFGYPSAYRIPFERYALLYGDTELARTYYRGSVKWEGSCFGMASSSSMFYQAGNGISVASFNSNAAIPYDLRVNDRNGSWDMTVRDFIETMQVSWWSSAIQKEVSSSINQLDSLCQAVKAFQTTGKDPVIIAAYEDLTYGHAVVGYGIEYVNSAEDHLLVYDCNYPNQERYIDLYKNTSGQYVGWYYSINDSHPCGTDFDGSFFVFMPQSAVLQAWNNRAGAADAAMSLMMVGTGSATIYDANGNVAATIRNGEVVTNRTDIYAVNNIGVTADGKIPESSGTALWLPTGLYTVSNGDASAGRFEATMVNVDQSATVSTAASEITFGVSDERTVNYIEVSGAGKDYAITLGSTLAAGYETVELSGRTGTEKTALAQAGGELYAVGADGGTLQIDGEAAPNSVLSEDMPDVAALFARPRFTDLSPNAFYLDAVAWAVMRNITTGTTDTTFSPKETCTHRDILTFLWRAAGSPESGVRPSFDGLSGTEYFYPALCWAAEKGMIDESLPNRGKDPCTRADAVRYIWYAADKPAASYDGKFADVPASSPYATAVAWAVANGVTNGTGDTTFTPSRTCNRGEIVTFLYRAYNK